MVCCRVCYFVDFDCTLSLDLPYFGNLIGRLLSVQQSIADRKPVVVFVKDLNEHQKHTAMTSHMTSHGTPRRLLDIERDSVGSASNTDSGNGNSSEYSGPDSDPSPPMMTSSIVTAGAAAGIPIPGSASFASACKFDIIISQDQ